MKKWICFICLCCFVQISYADVLKLKDGRTFYGKFVENESGGDEVIFRLAGSENVFGVKLEEIKEKEFEGYEKYRGKDLCDIPENMETCKQNKLNYEYNKSLFEEILIEEDQAICERFRGGGDIKKNCYQLAKFYLSTRSKDKSKCSIFESDYVRFSCIAAIEKYVADPKNYKFKGYEDLKALWGKKDLPVMTFK